MNTPHEKLKNNLPSQIDAAYEFAAHSLLQNDKDLYRLCLYEPQTPKKRAYICVFALLTELEKIRLISNASDGHIGMLRTKWWYDALSLEKASTHEQTQLLLALKTSITDGYINKEYLLELIALCAKETALPQTPEADSYKEHFDAKGLVTAQTLGINTALMQDIMYLRGFRYFHMPDIKSAPQKKERPISKFENKLNSYIRILRHNIKSKNSMDMGVCDMIKLHLF